MRNVLYLILAILFFAFAYYVYWVVAQESGGVADAPTTRGVAPRSIGPPPSELVLFLQQWQPVITLISSLGGLLSFIMQVRIWMRSRA